MYHVYIEAGGEVLCQTADDAIDYVKWWAKEKGVLDTLTLDYFDVDMTYMDFHVDCNGICRLGYIELLPIWEGPAS